MLNVLSYENSLENSLANFAHCVHWWFRLRKIRVMRLLQLSWYMIIYRHIIWCTTTGTIMINQITNFNNIVSRHSTTWLRRVFPLLVLYMAITISGAHDVGVFFLFEFVLLWDLYIVLDLLIASQTSTMIILIYTHFFYISFASVYAVNRWDEQWSVVFFFQFGL